jgi:predicted nucleic acid-binding protein
MKALIFDASTLISFAMNGLYDELRHLKEIFNGKFLITKEVKGEVIDRPLTIKRFELEALKIKKLFDEGVLEMPSSLDISDKEISRDTNRIIETANTTFKSGGHHLKLIDLGEASCIALARALEERKIGCVIAVDERTMRMLVEKPENLEKLLENKLHTNIISNKNNLKMFKGFKIIRSTELVYLAYKKGLIELDNGIVLDALLYAMKFKGCSISEEEIREAERIN